MPLNTNVQASIAEPAYTPTMVGDETDFQELRAKGAQLASELPWVPRIKSSSVFSDRCRQLKKKLMPMMASVGASVARSPLTDDVRWLRDNESLIYSDLLAIGSDLKLHRRLPHVHTFAGENIPRILAVAMGFLKATGYQFSEQAFISFCLGFQENSPLELREFIAVVSALKLVLLEEISERGRKVVQIPASDSCEMGVCVQSLREVGQISWQEVLEPLVLFDQTLRKDPAGYYAAMDFESRDLYRRKLSAIAAQSDLTEMQVADEALALARGAYDRKYGDPRIARRESHIGYYLVAEGRELLAARVGCKPDPLQRLRGWLRRYPDEFFMPGIALLTCSFITAYLLLVTPRESSPGLILVSMLLLLLPSSQSAVQIIDYVITALLPPEILPKLDFSKGIPADCLTLVAIPTLLLNEKQVRGLVEDLEVRFLGNHDPNMHFAILSDLPDAY